jgi:DNA-binding NarL/FixJ family response regulator
MAVAADARILFANRAALGATARAAALRIERGVLGAASPCDAASLTKAIHLAGLGRRSLLQFVATSRGLRYVSVVPLATEAASPGGATAGLIFGRAALCEPLGIDAFGRQHGLTQAECAVLASLCDGQTPREIAEEREVAVCTVRTHVRSVLEKSGARSVSQLIRLTAMLPPVLSLAT